MACAKVDTKNLHPSCSALNVRSPSCSSIASDSGKEMACVLMLVVSHVALSSGRSVRPSDAPKHEGVLLGRAPTTIRRINAKCEASNTRRSRRNCMLSAHTLDNMGSGTRAARAVFSSDADPRSASGCSPVRSPGSAAGWAKGVLVPNALLWEVVDSAAAERGAVASGGGMRSYRSMYAECGFGAILWTCFCISASHCSTGSTPP